MSNTEKISRKVDMQIYFQTSLVLSIIVNPGVPVPVDSYVDCLLSVTVLVFILPSWHCPLALMV